jgi:hypothetical protein
MSPFRRRPSIAVVALAFAGAAWAATGQTAKPPYDTFYYIHDHLRLEAYVYWPTAPISSSIRRIHRKAIPAKSRPGI